MRRLALLAVLPLLSCASLRWPLTSPFNDTTAARWCGAVTKGQAVYTAIVTDLDDVAASSDWLLQYGLAKGVVEVLGRGLITQCAQEPTKEDLAYAVSEGAEALGDLVELHEQVTAPKARPGESMVMAFATAPTTAIPHASILQELRMAEAEAKAVLAKR